MALAVVAALAAVAPSPHRRSLAIVARNAAVDMADARATNITVVAIYLVATIGSALFLARRKRTSSSEEYFLAGRRLPAWQLGISLISTAMSSVTYLAYPATSFSTNWLLLNKDFSLPLVCLAAALWALPFYRARVRGFSVFELVEERFNVGCRLYCSGVYCLLQLARTCTVLYLVGFPLSTLTTLPHSVVVVASGVLIGLYTIVGGLTAVVLTDVVQGATLVCGGALTLGCVASLVPGGLRGIIDEALAADKLSLTVDMSDAGRSPPLLWLFGASSYLLVGFLYNDTVQRYLAARSTRDARIALGLMGALSLPIWCFFLMLGTALWAYAALPEGAALLADTEPDAVVTTFALEALPGGVGGLVLAGVLAAAMSSLDSSLNSVAGVVTTDWYQRLYWRGAPLGDAQLQRAGRAASLAMAALSVVGALGLRSVPKEGMNDLYNGLMSVTGGAGGGLMVLTVMTTSTREQVSDGDGGPARWHTPTIDARTAVVGIAASSVAALVAALCSFGAFGDGCSLSYYYLLPLSNLAFVTTVGACVGARRARARLRGAAPAVELMAGT